MTRTGGYTVKAMSYAMQHSSEAAAGDAQTHPAVSRRLSAGKWTVIGGVAGLDITGSILSELSAAEEEELEMTESVRERSMPNFGPRRAVLWAGNVTTECKEEMEPLGEGRRSRLSVDASDGVRSRKFCVMSPATGDASR